MRAHFHTYEIRIKKRFGPLLWMGATKHQKNILVLCKLLRRSDRLVESSMGAMVEERNLSSN